MDQQHPEDKVVADMSKANTPADLSNVFKEMADLKATLSPDDWKATIDRMNAPSEGEGILNAMGVGGFKIHDFIVDTDPNKDVLEIVSKDINKTQNQAVEVHADGSAQAVTLSKIAEDDANAAVVALANPLLPASDASAAAAPPLANSTDSAALPPQAPADASAAPGALAGLSQSLSAPSPQRDAPAALPAAAAPQGDASAALPAAAAPQADAPAALPPKSAPHADTSAGLPASQIALGAHGRMADVDANGNATYTIKQHDTLWSIAADVLMANGNKAPSQTDIANLSAKLATANAAVVEDKGNKIFAGRKLIIPLATDANASAAEAPSMLAKAPESPPAPIGVDPKSDMLKPSQEGAYNPLAPKGMAEGAVDASQMESTNGIVNRIYADGQTGARGVKGEIADGIWGFFDTKFTGGETLDANGKLLTRDVTYDSPITMKFQDGNGGATEIANVVSVKTKLDADGNYYTTIADANQNVRTAKTAADGTVKSISSPYPATAETMIPAADNNAQAAAADAPVQGGPPLMLDARNLQATAAATDTSSPLAGIVSIPTDFANLPATADATTAQALPTAADAPVAMTPANAQASPAPEVAVQLAPAPSADPPPYEFDGPSHQKKM